MSLKGNQKNSDICSKVSGLYDKLDSFEFYLCPLISLILFELTDRLSEGLQKVSSSIGVGIQLVQHTIRELTISRSDDKFNEIWQQAVSLAEEMDAEAPKLPRRQVAAPKRFESAQHHVFSTPEDYYRAQ